MDETDRDKGYTGINILGLLFFPAFLASVGMMALMIGGGAYGISQGGSSNVMFGMVFLALGGSSCVAVVCSMLR